MTHQGSRIRLIMDWRAAVIAGLVSGLLTMVLWMILLTMTTGGSAWTPLHHIAAILLGEGVLAPSQSINWQVVITGLFIHLVLSIFYAVILAFIIHRWGLIIGILGGAMFGLAIYAINYYTFSALFPWFFSLRSWIALVGHVFFGMMVGGIYESLERDVYIAEDASAPETGVSA